MKKDAAFLELQVLSVCYGMFNSQIKARKALNNLKIKYPKFWSSIAKTV